MIRFSALTSCAFNKEGADQKEGDSSAAQATSFLSTVHATHPKGESKQLINNT
jgi:hypothetical protein